MKFQQTRRRSHSIGRVPEFSENETLQQANFGHLPQTVAVSPHMLLPLQIASDNKSQI